MKLRSIRWRKTIDGLVRAGSALAACAGLAALSWVLCTVLVKGAPAVSWGLLTRLTPAPPGGEGGVANAILGTVMMLGLATLIALPLGLMAGVFLAEFARDTRLGAAVRFGANTMMGLPSIIVGLFVYTVVVLPMGGFSGWAGSVALAVIMLPVVTRTAEDMLCLVPYSLREAAMALGVPRWKVTLGVVFRAAKAGLATGALLAVARVSGETAPLLFTSLNSFYWPASLGQPTPNLTMTIYEFSKSPYEALNRMAWGASLLITVGVLAVTLTTRIAMRRRAGND
jgi:phosphate transport system permease protein